MNFDELSERLKVINEVKEEERKKRRREQDDPNNPRRPDRRPRPKTAPLPDLPENESWKERTMALGWVLWVLKDLKAVRPPWRIMAGKQVEIVELDVVLYGCPCVKVRVLGNSSRLKLTVAVHHFIEAVDWDDIN